MASKYSEWDKYYREYPIEDLGWELGKPRPILVEYMQKELLPNLGNALDLCCGVGTNTIYLAQTKYYVVGLDISPTAIKIAKQKSKKAKGKMNFSIGSFLNLPFRECTFDFVHDMGCFHHVEVEERSKFIMEIHRVLQSGGTYMLTCFSYRNGPSKKHFTTQKIVDLFSGNFEIGSFRHYPSLEGDGVTRFFYTVLLKKPISK